MEIKLKGNKLELIASDVEVLDMIEALSQQLSNKARVGHALTISKPIIITKSGSSDDNRPFAGALHVHIE